MQSNKEFNVIIKCDAILKKEAENVFYATCPGLPGMFSQDTTIETTLEGLRNCVKVYMEMALEKGWEIKQDEFFSYHIIETSSEKISSTIQGNFDPIINTREQHYQLNIFA